MKPCPYCGTLLASALVAAIVNPSRPESCPASTRAQRRADALVVGDSAEAAARRLVALALLGAARIAR